MALETSSVAGCQCRFAAISCQGAEVVCPTSLSPGVAFFVCCWLGQDVTPTPVPTARMRLEGINFPAVDDTAVAAEDGQLVDQQASCLGQVSAASHGAVVGF